MKSDKIFDKKLIGYVYFVLDYNRNLLDKERFLKHLLKDVHKTKIGFAGYNAKKYLIKNLKFQLFDEEEIKAVPSYSINKQQVFCIIKEVLKKCHKSIVSEPTRIFIFPRFKSFAKEKLSGVGGFSPWKYTLDIDVNPMAKEWRSALRATVCHEFCHSVIHKYHEEETLLDSLIFEGLAEHFRESVVGGGQANWTKAVSEMKCREIFLLIKDKLDVKDAKLYYAVFFGSNKYPLWAGHSIGYYIVRSFLKKNQYADWNEIIKLTPKEILDKSGF